MSRLRSRLVAACGLAIGLTLPAPSAAEAAAPHVVQPGETLWSIAAANDLTTRTVAVFNGVDENAQVVAGQTLHIPTVSEGETALANAGLEEAPADEDPAAHGLGPAPAAGHIYSPDGELHLDPAAAAAWNEMRQESLAHYGIDLYPIGPLGAGRTYDEQHQLWDVFLLGQGSPANPPGSSSHEHGLAVDVATPEMRSVIDEIGAVFGWAKVEAPSEWWHVTYVGG